MTLMAYGWNGTLLRRAAKALEFFLPVCSGATCEAPMKKLFLFLSFSLASVAAYAHGCPGEMKAIDAKLATNPQVAAADISKVKALRADGEKFHKDGKHTESMKALGDAKKMLGI